MTIRLVSRRQPQQPRRPRRILGAEARRRCMGRLRKAIADVVEQLISARGHGGRGQRRSAVALEGFSGPFWECLWRDDGRGSYVGQVIFCYDLGC